MANNYLEFSEVLADITPEEHAWIEKQLGSGWIDGNGKPLPDDCADDAEDECPLFIAEYDPETDPAPVGPDKDWGDAGFAHGWDGDDCLLIYADESGIVEHVAYFVHKFLRTFRKNDCWGLTWAGTCSKPRIGEFGGGAIFVTAEDIQFENSYDWVERQRVAFQQGVTHGNT
jgi:hypothetical protein